MRNMAAICQLDELHIIYIFECHLDEYTKVTYRIRVIYALQNNLVPTP